MCSLERRRRVFLLPFGYDVQGVVRQWPLEPQRRGRLAFKPKLELFGRRQNNRHRLGVNWRDDGLCLCRQEAEQLVLAVDRRALGASHAAPARPQAGEGGERAIDGDREPLRRLARLGVSAYSQNDVAVAAAASAEPRLPVGTAQAASVSPTSRGIVYIDLTDGR